MARKTWQHHNRFDFGALALNENLAKSKNMITPIKYHRLHRFSKDYAGSDVICVINFNGGKNE